VERPAFIDGDRFHSGLTYEGYLEVLEAAARAPAGAEMSAEECDRLKYTQLNQRRTRRIRKTYQVSEPARRALAAIDVPQRWLVLTEPWCGDSAQCLPYIAAMAALSPRIELRILLRDENPDVMDRYLTGGKRGIPIVIAADAAGREIFRWGPRPRPAAELVAQAMASGLPREERLERLHLWYGRDRGRTIEAEFTRLLTAPPAAPRRP
jgi:hypothetical protein